MPLYNGNYAAPVWINNQPPAINQTELLAMSQTIEESQILTGTGAPTQYVSGKVGQRYADTSTAPYTIYKLVEAAEDANVWEPDDADGNLALDYNAASTYSEGEYCIHAGLLYRANTAINPAEAWNSAHWTRVWLADELEAHVADTQNPHEVTAAQVGLGNVANVLQYSASNKPSAEDVTYSGTVGGIVVTDVKGALDSIPTGSNAIPYADSSPGSAGVSDYYARADHSHPTDPSKVPISRKINNTALNSDLVLFFGNTITFSLSWSGSGPYTQNVSLNTGYVWDGVIVGITSKSRVSLEPTATQIAQLIADGVTALTIENNSGTLTAYALGAAPTTAMTIACTVMEVNP